jgi:hypothetical protein
MLRQREMRTKEKRGAQDYFIESDFDIDAIPSNDFGLITRPGNP